MHSSVGIRTAFCRISIAIVAVAMTFSNITVGGASSCTDTWVATTTTQAPVGRFDHAAVWTGSEMIVWGGFDQAGYNWLNSGGRYKPSTNSWTVTATLGAPTRRSYHTGVWTGSEMIIWGGFAQRFEGSVNYSETNTGAKYDPVTDSWRAVSTNKAPFERSRHTAIWTGSEMVVWGGQIGNGSPLGTGGRYDPVTNTWRGVSTIGAPTARYLHSAIWTGKEMIIWGGSTNDGTGARYNPANDTWTAISGTNAPSARYVHTAVWTGSEMIIWGGGGNSPPALNTGGRYNPVTDSWTSTSTTNAPTSRYEHTAVWTGSEMIVWGGGYGPPQNTGGRYDPAQDTWSKTTVVDAPQARRDHSVFWTGSQMLVWGGWVDPNVTVNTGGLYCASVPGQLLNISTRMRVVAGDNALIGGFIVSGAGEKKVVVRGIGPSLTNVGITGALADPRLELHNASMTVASNNDWKDAQETEVRASGLAPNDDLESAIVATLPANDSAYTMILAGKNGDAGIGVVELYDLEPSAGSTLANISTRGFVNTDDNVMIGGLIVGSADRGPAKVVVRAIGPSLSSFGIPNPLQDPILELHNASGATIATNDDWKVNDTGGSQEDEISATGLAPTNDSESVLVRMLPADSYTAILRGKNSTAGVGLVEVYNLH